MNYEWIPISFMNYDSKCATCLLAQSCLNGEKKTNTSNYFPAYN